MKILAILKLLAFLLIGNINGQEDLDPLSLASLLIKNNNLNRAQSVLEKIKDPDDVQTERFYTLLGILAVKQKRYDIAVDKLLLAEKSGLEKNDLPEFYEILSRAYLLNKKYEKALDILNSRVTILEQRPLYYQLLSKLYFETHRSEKGWDILNKGINRFSKNFPLKKQKWFYLFSNNLLEVSKNYLYEIINEDKFTSLELARIAYRYRERKQLDTAATLAEIARIKDPKNEEIIKELARIYIEKKEMLSAAQVFDSLAMANPKYMSEASELWRKSGFLMRAQYLAYQITDPEKALKQKMTLALTNKNFIKISQMSSAVERSDLNANEDILYTLAYSHFMLGDFSKAEKYLGPIIRKDLLKKALSLRETIQNCTENEAICL